MFQPLEVTEARTIWIDSPSDDRLGFQDSSRVQIDRSPMSTGDFSEPCDGFKATLLGGMWPDDDELRLLVVGIVPGSEMALNYLKRLVPADIQMAAVVQDDIGVTDAALEEGFRVKGMEILRSLVQIMPSWSGQQERAMFVLPGLLRVKPETVKSASQRGSTAAVNKESKSKMSFDMWRIQVDMKLVASGCTGTDELFGTKEKLTALRVDYDTGISPSDYANAYISADV